MSAVDADSILEIHNITKKFPGVVALNDVSFDVKEGEILSICGENGAGKSTLMKILSGEYEHGSYSGKIVMEGTEIKITSNHMAEKIGIAMIYQEISVELDLSVAENIFLGRLHKTKSGRIDWNKIRKESQDVLRKLRIDLDEKLNMRDLSASTQQLVCIARALVRNPKILILDEPTAALTENETEYLINILNDLKKSGISCIYISHKLDEIFRISDRVIVMRDACIVSSYSRDQIDPARIIEDMIGRRLDEIYPSMIGKEIGDEIMRVENLTVPHPNAAKNIVSDITFSLHRGEVLGIVGLVGSGRSELIRAIFGALPKTEGSVDIEGKRCRIHKPGAAIKYGIGMLTEDRKSDGIVGAMNILQNMTLSILKKLSKYGIINSKKEHNVAGKYFESLRIKAPSIKTSIMSLSGGNQQKVVLAKSLLTDMKVLMLDEPTRGVDIGAKAEIYKIIHDLAINGLSIIMISSEYPELLAMCDRFIVIANGGIVGELTKRDADEAKIMRMASGV